METLDAPPLAGHPCAMRPHRASSSRAGLFAPERRFDPDCPELIDRPGLNRRLLWEELLTLERVNRRLGGQQLVLQYVHTLVKAAGLTSLSVLDLATGHADIPRALAAWARRQQLPVTITAVDRNADILSLARESSVGWPEIRLEERALPDLPYAAGSFDVVLCSLALHHFTAEDAVTILRRMQELARVGYVANDLRRNWLAIWTTELVSRTVIRSPLMRHDARQSCRAAFTVRELRSLAQQAGLRRFHIKRHHAVFRMVLLGWT